MPADPCPRAVQRADGESHSEFNAQLLTTAREAAGLTQTALAKAIGVSQSLIGRWEGRLGATPDAGQIEALAEVLGVRPTLFSLVRPIATTSLSEFYHRALSSARRGEVKKIHANCALFELKIDLLLRAHDEDAVEETIPSIDPDNHAGNVAKVAAMARAAMGVPDGPIPSLVDVIERAGGIVLDHGIESDKVEALCRWVQGLPKLFFINGRRPADRTRFSLAHELGHTVMHHRRDVEPRLAEEQANEFASAFLMPERPMRVDLRPSLGLADLANLKRKWRVSMQAIVRRAKTLRVIDDRRYTSLMQQFSRRGWRKSEPVAIMGETPRVFRRLLQEHLDSGYSRKELAALMMITDANFEELLQDVNAPSYEDNGVRLRLVR